MRIVAKRTVEDAYWLYKRPSRLWGRVPWRDWPANKGEHALLEDIDAAVRSARGLTLLFLLVSARKFLRA